MYVVTVIFEVDRGDAEIFLERVCQQARDSLEKEPGCRRFDVSVCTKVAERVLLYEIYDTAEAFADHLDTDHFKAFDLEVSPITRSKEIRSWVLA